MTDSKKKNLALSAVIALLGSLLFVGAPAKAANEVTIDLASGTTYNAIAGEAFEIRAVLGATITSNNYDKLSFKVANADAATIAATVSANLSGGATTGSSKLTSFVLAHGATASNTASMTLKLAATTADVVIGVTAWIDSDGDGVVDSGEFSTTQNINFWALSNVTWTTTLTAPVLGDTRVTASITTNKALNLNQLANTLAVGYATVSAASVYATVSGTSTTVSTGGVFTAGTTVTLDTAGTSGTAGVSHTALASNTYVAQGVYNSVEVGAESVAAVGADPVTTVLAPTLSAGANVKGNKVRVGTTALTFTAIVSKSAGVKAAEGTVMSVTIEEGAVDGMASLSTVVAGGKSLANTVTTTKQSITFSAAVGADGKVSIPVALSGLAAGNSFDVKVSNGADSANTTVTMTATTVSSFTNQSVLGTDGVIKTTKGGSFTLQFGAMDNFDQPLPSSGHRVVLTNAGGTATVSGELVNGIATFAVTDDAAKTEGQYSAQLQVYNTSSLAYDNAIAAATINPTIVTTIAAPAAVTLAADSASNLVLNTWSHAAVDARMGATAPNVTSGNAADLSGQITDADGLGTSGNVTITGPADMMFKVGDVYTLGSVTVQTNANGAYSGITAYRQIAGKVTISAAVGSVTKDLGLTFLAAAETAGRNVAITAPAYAKAGSTFQVTAKVTDGWGNPVKVTTTSYITVTYTGPGFVTATLPSTTDAAGELKFSVLLGTADTGVGTIKVAYDGDATATTTVDNAAATATMTVGTAPAEASDAKVTLGTFQGYAALFVAGADGSKLSVKFAGKWYVVPSIDSGTKGYFLWKRNTGAGYPANVTVYIDGKPVDIKVNGEMVGTTASIVTK